jgi:hypothetical protein
MLADSARRCRKLDPVAPSFELRGARTSSKSRFKSWCSDYELATSTAGGAGRPQSRSNCIVRTIKWRRLKLRVEHRAPGLGCGCCGKDVEIHDHLFLVEHARRSIGMSSRANAREIFGLFDSGRSFDFD